MLHIFDGVYVSRFNVLFVSLAGDDNRIEFSRQRNRQKFYGLKEAVHIAEHYGLRKKKGSSLNEIIIAPAVLKLLYV